MLGFNGLLHIATGMPQTNAVGVKVETPFDEHVVLNGNMLFFDGPNTKFIYGDRVPLYFQPGSTENVYHLASYSAPILNDDLLNGGHFLPGTHYDTSNLDLAILADSGVNVDAPLTKASFSTQTFAGRVEGQSESINQLFAAKDPDGESITLFAVFNTDTNAGHFHIPNGSVFLNNQYVPTSGDQPGGQVIYMSPSDFANAKFVIGNTSGLNNLYCSAYDGHEWGPWAHMTVSTAFT